MKLILSLFLAGAVAAQTSSPTTSSQPVRDPQAIVVVEQAMAALGGHEAHRGVRSVAIKGTMQEPDSQAASSFLWEDDFTGKTPEFRKEVRSGNSVRTFVSGHGTPAHIQEGKVRQMPAQAAWAAPPFYLPGIVLARELKNQSYSFRLIQSAGDGPLIHVRVSWELNSVTASLGAQDWYFDPGNSLPVRVQYMLPSTAKPGYLKSAAIEFSDFRSNAGIAVPFHMTNYGVDGKARSFIITEVQTNATFGASHFEAQGGQR